MKKEVLYGKDDCSSTWIETTKNLSIRWCRKKAWFVRTTTFSLSWVRSNQIYFGDITGGSCSYLRWMNPMLRRGHISKALLLLRTWWSTTPLGLLFVYCLQGARFDAIRIDLRILVMYQFMIVFRQKWWSGVRLITIFQSWIQLITMMNRTDHRAIEKDRKIESSPSISLVLSFKSVVLLTIFNASFRTPRWCEEENNHWEYNDVDCSVYLPAAFGGSRCAV
jgi:hypothetical protein